MCRRLELHPSKSLGQNFVVDPGTVCRIVKLADAGPHVIEVGPGLGSLTLALLAAGHHVTAIELDPVLAAQLPLTVAGRAAGLADRLTVVTANALDVTELPASPNPTTTPSSPTNSRETELSHTPTQARETELWHNPAALVANLPYNVAVPLLLTYLERFDFITKALVMVQAEVAARLVAKPGSRTYGVPSAKLAWWGTARLAGQVPRNVFYPVPRVDSSLVLFQRWGPTDEPHSSLSELGHLKAAQYPAVARVIDAAFAQRRKTLRSALSGLAGSKEAAEAALIKAKVEPSQRGEQLAAPDFARIAGALGLMEAP